MPMSNLSLIHNFKFSSIKTFLTAHLKTTVHTQFVGIFTIYLQTKVHSPKYN
jgi:hypothetical protein